ncbi:DEAD/DEAH box helicase family protein [archaeon AH-315-M20]|nr:DEAD/DEAH box helicase family protein [archaeon AH-315-M20]
MSIIKKSLAPEDLLLHLNEKAKKYDISKYEDFIYELCGDWEFQKGAIRNTLRYFLSGEYQDSKQLLEENFKKNQVMKSFANKDFFIKNLAFPYKLACTIDLATGTGKSWVIYGVARILLAKGLVDKVLILCPSKTIKYELLKKFNAFAENSVLTDALPRDSKIRVPGLKQSDETIEVGDICIDNVHKTYDHVSSSISDSLERKGSRTLVINDEAHHILNPKGAGENLKMLEWKKFLDDSKYNFKYIMNLSGTPYKGDVYFNDVIYRFSIRDAISQGYVKDIDYLKKDKAKNWKEKWQAILDNHNDLKKEYPKAKKHITIVVTNKISETNKLVDDIKLFLKNNTKLSYEQIDEKVIPITSSPQHEEFREILKTVDKPENPVEWIVSVSMLTEGWDVSNIFQIVPHEKRAFDSKLLISQVLGRGLRVPFEYRDSKIKPRVRVYNHIAWSEKIDHLVLEVAEISNLLNSTVIRDSIYNFGLHKISIDKNIKTQKKVSKKTDIKPPKSLGFSTTETGREAVYTQALERRDYTRITDVSKHLKKYTIEQATNAIFSNLYLFDMERGLDITTKVSKEYIRKLIEEELKNIGEKWVSEENLQNGKLSFNVMLRPYTGISKIEDVYGKVIQINTSEMGFSLMSESSFKNYGGLVTSNENLKNMGKEELEVINKIKKDIKTGQTTLTGQGYIQPKFIDNLKQEQYKSPLDITLLSYKPEREFVEKLVNNYSKYIDTWVKSKDKGFFNIPYIYRPGTHSLQREFNPDFIFKKGNKIIVIEIKSEDDSSVQNKDKLEGATSYFDKLNNKLKGKPQYEFHFLDERDYNTFFKKVLIGGKKFVSKLHAELLSKSREELKQGR